MILSLRLSRLINEIFHYVRRNKDYANLKSFIYLILPEYFQKQAIKYRRKYINSDFFKREFSNSIIFNEFHQSRNLEEACQNHFEYKLEHLLKWEDRNSMFFSIESRVPFLDHRLVEGIVSSPAEIKIKNGITKILLRESMKDVIPYEIRTRYQKVGFATPEDLWFRSESFREYLKSYLTQKEFGSANYIDPYEIKATIKNHENGNTNFSAEIWRWFNLEMWLQKYFN